jgi:disulfide bond formation protein DsbB
VTEFARVLNSLLIVILSLILLAALFLQFGLGQIPCPLCYLQRLGMIGIATGALLNITHGLRPGNYAFSLAAAIFGGAVAIRQIALHACPEFPTFGVPLWGFSLYTWSFLIHAASVVYVAILLFVQEEAKWDRHPRHMNWWDILASVLLLIVICANVAATLYQCGFGSCD